MAEYRPTQVFSNGKEEVVLPAKCICPEDEAQIAEFKAKGFKEKGGVREPGPARSEPVEVRGDSNEAATSSGGDTNKG